MLHELTQIMQQKDMPFAQCLNRICMNPPEEDSEDDIMLWSREISIGHDHKDYPLKAMHVYAKNSSCDEWNKIMLNSLNGKTFVNIAKDCRKDTGTNLANIAFPANPKDTGNLHKTLTESACLCDDNNKYRCQ